MKAFFRIVEMIKPSQFITSTLRWCGLGRPMKDREKIYRAFLLKAVYDLPTTKGLIENLKNRNSRGGGKGGSHSKIEFLRLFWKKVVLNVSRWAWRMKKRVIYRGKPIFFEIGSIMKAS